MLEEVDDSVKAGPFNLAERSMSHSVEVSISHSVKAGTSDTAEEAGAPHSADAGTSNSADADTSNSADAGTSHSAEAGTSHSADTGNSQSADAGSSQIIVTRSRSVKFTADNEPVNIEADEGEKPLKQPRTEFCKCKSKCVRKPYCACRKQGKLCTKSCHPGALALCTNK